MGKKIVVDLDSEGNLHAETFGFTGRICFDEFDKLFADIVEDRHYDPKIENVTVVRVDERLNDTSNTNVTKTQNVKEVKRSH